MFIKRQMTKKLVEASRHFPVISLTGPRQSGKTTLVKAIFPDKKYVSLEDPDIRLYANNDPRGFLETYANGVIIDEIQRVPELFSFIQGIVDAHKQPGEFILTGSQNFLLLESISQSLAGRASLHTLLPFSISELMPTIGDDYMSYLFKGLYPRVHEASVDPRDWYSNYIATYIERDVRQIKNITNLSAFHLFLKICAGRIGQLLNLSSIAIDCGITHNTARSWLSILEASHLIFLLRPSHKSFRKRLVKMPKLYFIDTGLACSLLEIENINQLDTHPIRGGLFENLIICEFLKYYLHNGKRSAMSFWRDKTGHEVDCLLEETNQVYAIEIKSGRTVTTDFFANLDYFSKLSKDCKNYIIYGGVERQKRAQGDVVPWPHTTDFMFP